jgi:hypothetical protein
MEYRWKRVWKVCSWILALTSSFYVNFAIGEGHAEDRGLLPTGADNDQIIQQLANMICDPSSSFFVLHGVGLDDLRVILDKHGLQSSMPIDLCRQALCHHVLNGHCAKADGEQCRCIVGHFQPGALAPRLSSAMLDIISKPDFPLDVIRTICGGLGFHYSSVGERPCLKCELQKRHSQLLTRRAEAPVNFFKHFERSTKMEFLAHAGAHGLSCSGSTDDIRILLAHHFTCGECSKNAPTMKACSDARDAAQGMIFKLIPLQLHHIISLENDWYLRLYFVNRVSGLMLWWTCQHAHNIVN